MKKIWRPEGRWPKVGGTLEVRLIYGNGRYLHLWIERRQPYCDRGNYHALIDTNATHIDGADGFPRYYFNLQYAIEEMEAFMRKRDLI